MKKVIELEKINYGKKYLEISNRDGKRSWDGDSSIWNVIKFSKDCYTSEDFVSISDKMEKSVERVVEGFEQTFKDRKREATKEQIYFAEETAKVIFGKQIDDKISVIPAPCGFGKSTIKAEILKEVINLYKTTDFKNGIIIVGDRLADLKEILEGLEEAGLKEYAYMLESWNTDICKDKDITEVKPRMCFKCDYFYKCKIGLQQKEQSKYPILLMTNARLKECGQTVNRYKEYDNGERTLLLIDERPEILNTVKVDVKLLAEIKTYIDNLNYIDISDKTKLLTYWNEITAEIERKMESLRGNYKRYVLSNKNNLDIITEEFEELWTIYLKSDYKRELEHIRKVLNEGGFYVCESNKEFISTIGKSSLKEDYQDFKTIIFDGSALYDPLYLSMYKSDEENSDLRYLYIENSRTYENLNFNIYKQHKISKTKFKDQKYLHIALANFINNKEKVGFGEGDYVVTYKEQSRRIGERIKSQKVATYKENETYYFGNTKGSNAMQSCTRMFQLGWETMPDYEYVIQFLSCCCNWDNILERALDKEKAENYADWFQKKNRDTEELKGRTYSTDVKNFAFGVEEINRFQWFDIVSKFYQEIHRTRLRDYNCTDDIEVHLFNQKKVIFDLINGLFPKNSMKFIDEELMEFKKAKDKSFTKADGTKTDKQKILDWFENWNGETFKVSAMLKDCDITSKRWERLKKEDSIKDELSKCNSPKKGYYCRVS